jgi:hypothetical protein
MTFTNTFLIIALISFSCVNTFEFASLSEVSDIQADPYGKSLLETISLSLSNKGNVDEVQELLANLLLKLNQDQQRSDAWWAKENARLTALIALLNKKIKSLKAELVRLNDKRVKYEKLRDKAAKNLIQYRKQKDQNTKDIKLNEARRSDDNAAYKRSQSEHQDVLFAIDSVIKQLNHLVGSVSGKGKPTHVKASAEELRDLKNAFVQISQDEAEINAFIQTATEADQHILNQLIRQLNSIRASVVKSLNDDTAHEKRSKKVFQQLDALLRNDNKRLDSSIANQEKRWNAYVKEVARLKQKIADKERLLKAYQSQLTNAINERLAKERRYLADKAQRNTERKVIEKVQKIVQRRLANMTAYLKTQVN